jgi:peptidase E
MTLGTNGAALVLLNYFARQEGDLEELARQDKEKFLRHTDNKNLKFEIARPEKLKEQLARAKVMYTRGGETLSLLKKLSLTPNLEKYLKGKIIAGSSAGANALCKYFWSSNYKKIYQGLGILNFKIFCHYTPEKEANLAKLIQYKERLPVLILPDYKWVVWYK